MLTTLPRATVRRALTYTLALTVLWVSLAAWRPEVTYHLAPLLISAVPPIAVTLEDPREVKSQVVGAAAIAGLALGLGTTAFLSALGWLSGPSLLPAGGAVFEAVVFSLFGAAIGTAVALLRSRR